MNKKLVYSLVISGAIRYFISISKYSKSIENHVEISTPLNSFKRCKKKMKSFIYHSTDDLFSILVKEGAYLYDNGIDPYHGDVFHENPFLLIGANFLLNNFGQFISLILIALDLLTAVFIFYGSKAISRKNVSCSNKLLDEVKH
jgi:phosphatidylinositol glycan class U